MKQVIAVDIDEVLFPLTPTFMDYHNEVYKTQLTLAHKTCDFLEEIIGGTTAEMLAKMDDYLATRHYAGATPIPDARAVVRRLSKDYRLVLITARAASWREATERFIEEHFPGSFSDLLFCFGSNGPDDYIGKRQLCERVNARVLIDDTLHNIQSTSGNGIHGVLFGDYPWNQHPGLPGHITRCPDWPAVEVLLASGRLTAAAVTGPGPACSIAAQPALLSLA